MSEERGQALLVVVMMLWLGLVATLVLGVVATAIADRGESQQAADLAALAAARAMQESYDRLFAPVTVAGRPNPRRLSRAAYVARARSIAIATARRNGVEHPTIRFGREAAPTRVTVTVRSALRLAGLRVDDSRTAVAELAPDATAMAPLLSGAAGEYAGPFAYRQGKPMRPDVAVAFDRMSRAARSAGISLLIVSAFRSDAEQAVLFAAHPDPKWVGRPGHSMHRLGTELDLGPRSAYGWLARNADRFHFIQRMSWEPWHYGLRLNVGSTLREQDGGSGRGVPGFVPDRFAAPISQAAQRWNVSAHLLAAQIWQESRFDPNARSPAGARGIAQFMPATARAYGLADPFDPAQAIDAQGHLMRDLLREFGSVPLALAAYNAGPARVKACSCVPPIAETVNYVAAIIARMRGAGDPLAATGGLEVRLLS